MNNTILRIKKKVNDVEITIKMIKCPKNKYNKLHVTFNNDKNQVKVVELQINKRYRYVYDYNNHPYYYIEEKSTTISHMYTMYAMEICEKEQTIYIYNNVFGPRHLKNYFGKFYDNSILYTLNDELQKISYTGERIHFKNVEHFRNIEIIHIKQETYKYDYILMHNPSNTAYKSCANMKIGFYKEIFVFICALLNKPWKMYTDEISNGMKFEEHPEKINYPINMIFDRKMTSKEFFRDKFYYHDYFQKCTRYFLLCLKETIPKEYIPPKPLLFYIIKYSY